MIALDEVNHLAESGVNVPPRAAADHFKSIADETGVGLKRRDIDLQRLPFDGGPGPTPSR